MTVRPAIIGNPPATTDVRAGTNTLTTIIIPCREIDALSDRCIRECLVKCPEAAIIVVPDAMPADSAYGEAVRVLHSGVCHPSTKRNLAVRAATSDYIALIDSDAYPDEGWLTHAVQILQDDPTIGAVGGPNISPPDEPVGRRVVGNALRSWLVTGPMAFTKRKSPARECRQLSSCNLVLRRTDYLELGGMDDALYTGEDEDFCVRLRARGLRIHYAPEVTVFHQSRTIRGLFLQRLVWATEERIGARRWLSISDLCEKGAALLVCLLLAGWLLLFLPGFRWAYLAFLGGFLALLVIESIRHSGRPREVPGTFAALLVGNLTVGIGRLLKTIGYSPDHRKLYRNVD